MVERRKYKGVIDYRLDNKWTVYVHIVPNGKYYVGITSDKPQYRWGKNGYGYKDIMFYKAIKKYGWDNIQKDIIAENLTRGEASDMEKCLIKLLKTQDNEFGYNVAVGGLESNTIGLHPPNYNDFTDKIFGNLTVLYRADDAITKSGNRKTRWWCRCICGNTINVAPKKFKSKSLHCGCIETKTKSGSNPREQCKVTYELNDTYYKGITYSGDVFYFDINDYENIKDLNITYVNGSLGAWIYELGKRLTIKDILFSNNKGNKGSKGRIIYKDNDSLNIRRENIAFVDIDTHIKYIHLLKNIDNPFYHINKRGDSDNIFKISLKNINNKGVCFKTYEEAIYQRNELLKEMHKDSEILSSVVSLFYCN